MSFSFFIFELYSPPDPFWQPWYMLVETSCKMHTRLFVLPLLLANIESCNLIFAVAAAPRLICPDVLGRSDTTEEMFPFHKRKNLTKCAVQTRQLLPGAETFWLWRAENFTAERTLCLLSPPPVDADRLAAGDERLRRSRRGETLQIRTRL